MNLGDSVLGSTPRAETVAARLEVRLEDRLQHQLQGSLDNPVSGSRDTQATEFARRFGDRLLPHPGRDEPAGFEIISQTFQQHPGAEDDRGRLHPVDPGGPRALVPPHPAPRHNEGCRVHHEIEQVIETTAGISRRPLVQLRLHPKYPPLGLVEVGPRSARIHRRPPSSAWMLRTRWGPSPCGRLSRPRTTTTPPPHPDGISRPRTFPPANNLAGEGTAGTVPTFTPEPFDGLGAQLCPCGLATTTPQAFIVASRPATSTGPRVPRSKLRVRAATQPSVRLQLVDAP